MDRRTPLLSAAPALLLLLSLAAPLHGAGEPHVLSFEKRVHAEVHDGKKVVAQSHEVAPGESLWKILSRRGEVDPADYGEALRDFRRLNPQVKNPSRLSPGEKVRIPILAPRTVPAASEGKAEPHKVRKGETLSGILASRGIRGKEQARHIEAILALNPSVKDADRIFSGSTIYLPTEKYFQGPSPAPAPGEPQKETASALPGATPAKETPAVSLDRNAPSVGRAEGDMAASPATALAPAAPSGEAAPVGASGTKEGASPRPAPPRPSWRGLLADVTGALGEKWLDRGTLYLPARTGGEMTVSLSDYPLVRFSTGNQAVLDFRGDLPEGVRALLTDTWKTLRVVRVDREEDGSRALERFLQASGYAVVRDGLDRPLLIGDVAEVRLPARWQIFRTREAFDQADVTLLKEVPERLSPGLEAVLLYASRVGLRVLPYALDRAGRDGFLVGLSSKAEPSSEPPPPQRISSSGMEALESSLAVLGISAPAGDNGALRGTAPSPRTFAARGKRFAADPGLAPAERSRLEKEGYVLFPVENGEAGRSVFLRLLRAVGGSFERRSRFRVAGGEADGYDVFLSGDFVSAGEMVASRGYSHLVLVRGTLHPATRALLADLRVGVVEW